MGVGLDPESADRVGVLECYVSVCTASLGKPPFILPNLGLGRGVCSALLPLSMGEAQPGQCDLPGPRPGWRKTRRVGLGSLTLLFFSRLPSCSPGGTLIWGPLVGVNLAPQILRGVTQEGLANPDSGGVARPFCRRRGEDRWAELRSVLSPPPQAHLWPWGSRLGGRLGPLVSRVISIPRRPFWAPDPVAPPEAGSPGPLPPEPARLECSLLLAGPLPVRHVGSRFLSPTPAH